MCMLKYPSIEIRESMAVIRAFVWRIWHELFRYPLNTFVSVLQPIIETLPFWLLSKLYPNGLGNSGSSLILVALPVALGCANISVASTFEIVGEIRQLTLQALFLTPVKRWIIFISRPLFATMEESVKYLLTFILIYAYLRFAPIHLNYFVLAFAFGIVISYGLSMIFAALSLVSKRTDYTFVISALLTFFSAPWYRVSSLPPLMQAIGLLDPIYYPVTLMKDAFSFGAFRASLLWQGTLCVVMLWIISAAVANVTLRAVNRGALWGKQ